MTSEDLGREIHFNSIVLDCHNDTMLKVIDEETGLVKFDLGEETDFSIDIDKAKKGGLDIGYFAAFTSEKKTDEEANQAILSLLNAIYYTRNRNKDRVELALSSEDFYKILEEDKLVMLASIEGAYSLNEENAIELLRQYYDLGVRVLAYVWNDPNHLGQGTRGDKDQGLSPLGYRLTEEMNRLGMLIDVSHMNEKTFWDVAKASKAPIIASHSCASSLRKHVRNLTDAQIRKIAEGGGVINVNYWWELLGRKRDQVGIAEIVDNIDHIVKLVGIDHVGLGSDFDGASLPDDMKTALDLPNISVELVERGYSREEIEKILALNNIRVLREVEDLRLRKLSTSLKYDLDIENGDMVESQDQILIELEDFQHIRLIVDGIECDYRQDGRKISLKTDLEKGAFHVISFEVLDQDSNTNRITRLFYLK